MDFKTIIAEYVAEFVDVKHDDIISVIEVPPDTKMGDFALPCFIFSKQLKKAPANIALELKDKLTQKNLKEDHKNFELINNIGPYLNFFINKQHYSENILKKILKEQQHYGQAIIKKPPVVLIESPGPNTNKPLHLGHLRNMLLGQSLANIQRSIGKEVHMVNVVNDRGSHICKSMLAYQRFGNNTTPESENKKSDHFVGDYYVRYAQMESENPAIEHEVQDMLVRWENNDPEIRELWKKMNAWALEGFRQTYKKLDFNIEKEYFESETYKPGREIILDGLNSGVFQKNEEGAAIIDLEDKNLGTKVLLRSNGTSVYITQDIYMAHLRHEDFGFDELVYVVGNEQEYHFKVLFEIFKRLNFPFAEKCYHFSYGMVELPEGKMKSREGNVIDTDDLIENVTELAREELKRRYPDMDKAEMDKRSGIIALSAIRFFFLKHDPMKNFVFNPKESVSFDGETGPYVQYAYARINSIFRKSGIEDIRSYIAHADSSLLKEHNEFNLIKKLSEYPEIIADSAKNFKPSTLAHYLIDLAQGFNEFYHANQILSAEEELKRSRLKLIYCIQQIIASGLKLLHIETIDEM